ncbi:hypothetical protein WICPIJ_009822 [Wickerhamomyces pijperi]|uniref:MATE efflux family protein n=1 Tax=Wickerhamomyces pijperi TaxID=599730 RepID=A0A9P8PL65_WICPI|nr:hypothetical protein WICPIJ_009822 [Wickerhamomyces pijperi]
MSSDRTPLQQNEEQDLVSSNYASDTYTQSTNTNYGSIKATKSRTSLASRQYSDHEYDQDEESRYHSDGYSASIPYDDEDDEDHSINDSILDEPQLTYAVELFQILASSIPLSFTFFFEYLLAVNSLFLIGHLGSSELAAASLAVMTFNITGMAVFEGMATCLDTFCSQAYGAGKYHKVGVYFQRCTFMILAVSIPIMILWWFSKWFLKFIVPQEDLLELTQLYLRILCLGSPGLIAFETGKRFLQSQKIFHASTYVLFFCLPLNLILNYAFIQMWGYVGAPIAIVVTYWVMALLLLAYVKFVDGDKCWGGFSQRGLKHWDKLLKLALPGLIMIESEYLSFEILTVMASYFGTESLAAQSIISNIGSLVYQFPFAIASAIATRVAIYVGSGSIRSSKMSVRLSMFVALFTGLLSAGFIYFGRRPLALLFTSDEEVLQLAIKSMPILAINQLLDAFNIISAAILRSQGRQDVASIFNVISYYVVALPLAYVLAFVYDFEISGLWLGLGAGIACISAAEMVMVWQSKWKKIIREAREREEEDLEYFIDDQSTIASSAASSVIDFQY